MQPKLFLKALCWFKATKENYLREVFCDMNHYNYVAESGRIIHIIEFEAHPSFEKNAFLSI